ncbi:MAG: hypothetical protein KF768_01505 [Phycisphaeraceae bacterium]|nr:hypothetical protein [Phycisphaeraceae bacterium]
MSERNSALAAACLSIGLVNAWAPEAKAGMPVQVTIESNLLGDVTNAMLLLSNPDASSGVPGFLIADPALAGGVVPGCCLTWMIFDGVSAASFGSGYAMLGLTQHTDGTRSLVVSGNNLTHSHGLSFEQAFPGWTEGALIDELLSGGAGGEAFLRTNFAVLFTPHGAEADAVSFSLGAPFGTLRLDVTVIPSPGVGALVSLGLIGLVRRRRVS